MEVKEALASPVALASFVAQWNDCTLPATAWTHAAHILVAAWYAATVAEMDALAIMQAGIPRYNVATGGANTEDSGYHETLTRFWVAKIAAYLRRRAAGEPVLEQVRAAVDHFGSRRDWFADHYSFNVVKSREGAGAVGGAGFTAD